MEGAARNLFVPLSLAVGFSMIASYLLSSTFVPVLSVWLLRHYHHTCDESAAGWFSFVRFRDVLCRAPARRCCVARWLLVPAYLGRVPGC